MVIVQEQHMDLMYQKHPFLVNLDKKELHVHIDKYYLQIQKKLRNQLTKNLNRNKTIDNIICSTKNNFTIIGWIFLLKRLQMTK